MLWKKGHSRYMAWISALCPCSRAAPQQVKPQDSSKESNNGVCILEAVEAACLVPDRTCKAVPRFEKTRTRSSQCFAL